MSQLGVVEWDFVGTVNAQRKTKFTWQSVNYNYCLLVDGSIE